MGADGENIVRLAEWQRVREFAAAARASPAALAVRGEAGAGKSTLWRAGVEAAAAAGHRLLCCEPSASETDLSFAGLSDLLADVLPLVAGEIPGPQREALEIALLLRPGGDHPPTAHAVGLAVLAALRACVSGSPVLVGIDDVQWLDEASLDALTYAMRRLTSGSLALLMAARSEAVADPLTAGAPAPSRRWQDLLGALRVAEEIELAPLDTRQIQNLLPRTVTAAQARLVARQSRGSPFWAIQIAANLDADQAAVPELARVMTERLARSLSTDAAEVLATVAAAGRIGVAEALAALGCLNDPAASLDAAILAGVVVETGDRVTVAHPLIGAAAVEALPPGRRAALYRRLAAAASASPERHAHFAALAASRGPIPASRRRSTRPRTPRTPGLPTLPPGSSRRRRPGVEVGWHKIPARRAQTPPDGARVNYLLLPWPLRIRGSDFRPVAGPLQELAGDPFGFFEFDPSERFRLDLVDRMLTAARDHAGTVDVVVLPESAAGHDEIEGLEAVLARHGVTGLITGVRERAARPGQLPRNVVHIGASAGGQWFHIRQDKHHRWSLDEAQIRQYHLGGALSPHVRWWEAMEVPRRSVQFVEFGDGVTLASQVCEDLAQADDVAAVIRSVGPMIVVTPLLDGPQLSSRWSARYAGVLAGDPGSAVLTLTSFGMARRSRPPGQDCSPVVALWKSPGREAREISLEPGAQGVLLSARVAPTVRRSFDGRAPGRDGSDFADVSIHQVRAAGRGSGPAAARGSPPRSVLDTAELTVLTSWAEAAADALASAPGRAESLPANARAGAPWRAELGIREPSPRLAQVIGVMSGVLRTAAAAGSPLGSALLAVRDPRPGEQALGRLARAVLRSALQQRQARQAPRAARPDAAR